MAPEIFTDGIPVIRKAISVKGDVAKRKLEYAFKTDKLFCFQDFIIPEIEKQYSDMIDIIPEIGYTVLKRREGVYVYDGETGCGKMGDFR